MDDYDAQYRTTKDVFGAEPEAVLLRFVGELPRSLPVLDIGTGQGRHALHLARRGLHVDAIDPSGVATETVARTAAAEKLPIHTHTCGFDTFEAEPETFGGILVFGLIQILTREAIGVLTDRIRRWLAPSGLVLISAWTTADTSYTRRAQTAKKIGYNSFADDDGKDGAATIRTYLEPGEMLTMFADMESVHHWEGLGPKHQHGAGQFEQHGKVEAVLRKRGG